MFLLDTNTIIDFTNAKLHLSAKNIIKLTYAIIATTALLHNLTLISSNTADFKSIVGLKLIAPYLL